jgi:hypothetical protein
VLRPGDSRKRLAQRLKAAYADGLLSQETFANRLDQALSPGLVDPWRLVGELSFRASKRARRPVAKWLSSARLRAWSGRTEAPDVDECQLLALDWAGGTPELLIGRHRSCDVVLSSDAVSRRHARIFFRDGGWILQDLESTNGTRVNGVRVGRCRLAPGDRIRLGTEDLRID